MKIKRTFLIFIFSFIAISVTYSQNDSITINKHKVILGNMYEISFGDYKIEKGKLLGVNKETILMLINNEAEEFSIEDITGIKTLSGDIVINQPYKPQKIKGSIYSISAGYTRRDGKVDNGIYYFYNNPYYQMSGFNVQGDVLLKTSNYFGIRFDVNFTQTFSKIITGSPYYQAYDTATLKSEISLAGASIFAIKPALSFGYMSDESPFNINVNVGLGLGLILKSDDIINTYKIKGGTTNLYQTSVKSNNGLAIGTFGSIRISYKFFKKYSLFAEPSYQIWGNNIEHLMSINAGVTFLL